MRLLRGRISIFESKLIVVFHSFMFDLYECFDPSDLFL